MLLQIRHFIYTYLLDFIVCSISFFGVIFYVASFRMTYPSTIPNLTLISSSDQEQKQLYDLIEKEGIIHITPDSSTGFRNLQHLQRFAFTNNDVPIIDLHPSHVLNTQQETQFQKISKLCFVLMFLMFLCMYLPFFIYRQLR